MKPIISNSIKMGTCSIINSTGPCFFKSFATQIQISKERFYSFQGCEHPSRRQFEDAFLGTKQQPLTSTLTVLFLLLLLLLFLLLLLSITRILFQAGSHKKKKRKKRNVISRIVFVFQICFQESLPGLTSCTGYDVRNS